MHHRRLAANYDRTAHCTSDEGPSAAPTHAHQGLGCGARAVHRPREPSIRPSRALGACRTRGWAHAANGPPHIHIHHSPAAPPRLQRRPRPVRPLLPRAASAVGGGLRVGARGRETWAGGETPLVIPLGRRADPGGGGPGGAGGPPATRPPTRSRRPSASRGT